jgi:lactoylglutathione lyase
MIVEEALFTVAPGDEGAFEAAFDKAHAVISQAAGFHWAELRRGVEQPTVFLLRVGWDSVEHHLTGFRESPLYEQWRELIHPHLTEPAQVRHFTAPPEPVRFDHVGVNVRDFDASVSWYVKAFGLRVEFETYVEPLELRIAMLRQAGGHRIEILHRGGSVAGAKAADPASAALTEGYGHFALSVADLDASYQALLDSGAASAMAPQDSPEPGVRMAWVRDPEGNLIELVGR